MTARVLECVANERKAQTEKWGTQDWPDGTGSSLRFADADRAKKLCDEAHAAGRVTWRHILEEEVCEALAETDTKKLREELIQVAAVAVQWVEAIDRR